MFYLTRSECFNFSRPGYIQETLVPESARRIGEERCRLGYVMLRGVVVGLALTDLTM